MTLSWAVPVMLLPAAAVFAFRTVKHLMTVRMIKYFVEPPTRIKLQLAAALAVSTVCAALEIYRNEGSFWEPQGWPVAVGVLSSYLFFEMIVMDMLLINPYVLKAVPPQSKQLKCMYKLGMTRIICIALCTSALHRAALDDVYAVVACAAWGAMASFHAVLAVDSSAHARLATQVGIPLGTFTLLNLFVVHGLPCIVTAMWPPYHIELWHGAAAGAFAIAWGATSTGGTFVLDHIYAPNPPLVWYALFIVFVIAALITPLALGSFVSPAMASSHG